jgi:hypothetical protein
MISFKKILLEFKYPKLYHILSADSLFFVLKNNSIKGHNYSNISLTYYPNMNNYLGERAGAFFKLELDANKLSADYQLKRVDFVSRTGIKFDEGEFEVQSQEIKNIKKYITKIILIKEKVEDLKKYDWFSIIGINIKNSKFRNVPQMVSYIYKNFKKIFYIQENSKIIKDDKYIESLINSKLKKVYYGYAVYRKVYRKDKRGFSTEIYLPYDNKNKPIKQSVIGYDYENLHLHLNIRDFKNLNTPENKFYIFRFEFQSQNIKQLKDRNVILNTGHLDWIEPLSWNSKLKIKKPV